MNINHGDSSNMNKLLIHSLEQFAQASVLLMGKI